MHKHFFFPLLFDKLLHSRRDLLDLQSTRRSLCTDSNAVVTWADKARGKETMQFTFHSLCIMKVCKPNQKIC